MGQVADWDDHRFMESSPTESVVSFSSLSGWPISMLTKNVLQKVTHARNRPGLQIDRQLPPGSLGGLSRPLKNATTSLRCHVERPWDCAEKEKSQMAPALQISLAPGRTPPNLNHMMPHGAGNHPVKPWMLLVVRLYKMAVVLSHHVLGVVF